MPTRTREIRLKKRPSGLPSEDDFELAETTLDDPGQGEILVRNLWMSVDPYMRGRMEDRKSYITPFQVGAPLEGSAVGVIERSAAPHLGEGDLVTHFLGWREHALVPAADATRIDGDVVSPRTYLGPLGVPGLTAYAGLTRIGRPIAGETVFVSAGSGAVGSMVCQIAKIMGCRVVAAAGSDDKVTWLRDALGVDHAINYRATDDFAAALADACPDGLDVYFDNVGGEQLDAALAAANDSARFALCGMIGQYNAKRPPPGPSNIFQVVSKRLKLQGFIVIDHQDLMSEFTDTMSRWIADGRIQWRESVVEGLEAAPGAFIGLFSGENFGKMLVELGDTSADQRRA
ncbi:MAG: NADP-dependent oxidoreductase [Chthoniobacterales bacterium]|nr:NADP-dependent oxidoreductase [Chthoniobacterales bacterium]